jgi:hypothetical protein
MERKLRPIAAVIMMVLAFFSTLALQSSYASDSYTPNTRQVLDFLSNVTYIDMQSYRATLSLVSTSYPAEYEGRSYTTGKYELDGTALGGTSLIDVTFVLVNDKLCSVIINPRQDTPMYSQQLPSDMKIQAMELLQRYQTFSQSSDIDTMIAMLADVDISQNGTSVSGNVKQIITARTHSTLLQWKYTFNGVDYSGLGLGFNDGALNSFGDGRSYLHIGNTDVNVSKDEAVRIALDQSKTFSYTYEGKVISDFQIAESKIIAQLRTSNRSEPLTVYPVWIVDLPLTEWYPGYVSYLEVALWADSGEVISCAALGYGGDGALPVEDEPTSTPPASTSTVSPTPQTPLTSPTESTDSTPSPTDSPTAQPQATDTLNQNDGNSNALTVIYGVVIGAIIISAIAVVIVIRRRKNK